MATTARSRRRPAADHPAEDGATSAQQAPAAKKATPRKRAPAEAAAPETAAGAAAPATRQTAAKKAAAKKVATAKAAESGPPTPRKPGRRSTAAPKASAAPVAPAEAAPAEAAPARKAAARKTVARQPVRREPLTEPVPATASPAKAPLDGAVAAKPVPARKATAKKAVAKKAAAKKAVAQKAVAQKAAAEKADAERASSRKAPAKKAAAQPRPGKAAATKKASRPRPAAGAAAPAPAETAGLLDAPATEAPSGPQASQAPSTPQAPARPDHSALRHVLQDELARLLWQPGRACPQALADAAAGRVDAMGHLLPEDDQALPDLLRLAASAGHRIVVDAGAWRLLAAQRDARRRLQVLEAAYPEGPASPALQSLLRTTLPAFQAEGALFAVVAGRALIADERGLGKRVQAIAATLLWRRHFGVQRVLVLCTAAQRVAWQQAFVQFAGDALGTMPQLLEGTLHQRQSLWSTEAEVRILSPDTLDSDAAHIAHWAPELVIVDEPQQLPGWQALAAPQALVLCGAPLADPPALLQAIVGWLDQERQGALHALLRIQAAREQNLALSDDEIEALDDALSRVMLQRLRSEVEDQLPPRIFGARLVPLAPPQREAQDRLRQHVQRLLAGWQRCGYLSDADQWQLAAALRALPEVCHRSEPGNADSPLAEASIAALQAQLEDWRATGTQRIALACATPADQVLLAQRLPQDPPLHWLAANEAPPPQTEVVLQVGVPWSPPPAQAGAPAGQQWVFLAGQDSLEQGLARGLAARQDLPAGPGGDCGFLQGPSLTAWLQAWAQALP